MELEVWSGIIALQDIAVLPRTRIGGLLMQKESVWVVKVYVSMPGEFIEFIEPVVGFPSDHLKNQVLLLAG